MSRLGPQGTAIGLTLCALLAHPSIGHAQPGGSDVFSSQGEYDDHAVGGAHRWYDNHSTHAKQRSGHCLSILENAKAIQGTALVLDEQARQPGIGSRLASALRKQANEQFGLRDKNIRVFIDCFNQANRPHKGPPSDQFATSEDSPQHGNQQTPQGSQSFPPSRQTEDKGQKKVPGPSQKPGSNEPGIPADIFSTTGGKTPSDGIQTQPRDGEDSPSDVFETNSKGRQRSRPEQHVEVKDDSDCLPKIDSHVLVQLEGERNEILKTLAGGGYMTALTLKTYAQLLAAHLHHLTEPNEGLLVRTAHTMQRSAERAPEAVVQAGKAVAQYFADDTATNHRHLYGQVEKAVQRAEKEIKQKLQNPHITIAEIADSFLIGKATGTVCHWTSTTVVKLKKKADRAQEASKRLRETARAEPPTGSYCGVGQDKEDCFWKAMVNATGDPSYLKKTHAADMGREIVPELRMRFGGANAKDPLTGKPWHKILLVQGIPIPVSQDEFVDILYKRAPDGFEAIAFVDKPGQTGHIFSVAKLKGEVFFWDNQQKTTNLDIMMMGGSDLRLYRYK